MKKASLWLVALSGLAIGVPAHRLHAQQAANPAGAIREAEEVQAWFGELDQLQTRLQQIQTQALQDPAINAAQAELGNRIKAAMERLDPTLARNLARMEAMEAEVTTAGQRGDVARVQQLGAEADQIQRQFITVQGRALGQPELASQVTAFQQRLERKMVELDPDAARIIARYRELEQKLTADAPGTSRR